MRIQHPPSRASQKAELNSSRLRHRGQRRRRAPKSNGRRPGRTRCEEVTDGQSEGRGNSGQNDWARRQGEEKTSARGSTSTQLQHREAWDPLGLRRKPKTIRPPSWKRLLVISVENGLCRRPGRKLWRDLVPRVHENFFFARKQRDVRTRDRHVDCARCPHRFAFLSAQARRQLYHFETRYPVFQCWK